MKRMLNLFGIGLLSLLLNGCGSSVEDTIDNINDEETTAKAESEMVNEVVYPHDDVVEVNIEINTEIYHDLVANAIDEVYYTCDITYNGYTLSNVAIRAKGNSSLKDVAEQGGNRYSYNIDLNYYEDQDLSGIDKIILNNLYKDPSMMAEYLTYEALASLGTVSSRTTFVSLSINEEYYGLYLSVEHVGNEFLDNSFGNSDGELYKPDNGLGANLNFISDDANYTALVDGNSDDLTNEAVIELLDRIESGVDIDEIFNIESYLKYLAVSTYTVNLDSYQGGAYHNYYLYNNNGIFEWIAWDLNMSFNGFPKVSFTDLEATEYLIDEPFVGSSEKYTLIETILSDSNNLELYHTYLQELVDGYFNENIFEDRMIEIDNLINDYVEKDMNSFYSHDEYETALYNTNGASYSLLQFVADRTENVKDQLLGIIPSTNNGEGNGDGENNQPGIPPRR